MRAAVSTESALGPRGPLGLPLSERGFLLLAGGLELRSLGQDPLPQEIAVTGLNPSRAQESEVPSRTLCASWLLFFFLSFCKTNKTKLKKEYPKAKPPHPAFAG